MIKIDDLCVTQFLIRIAEFSSGTGDNTEFYTEDYDAIYCLSWNGGLGYVSLQRLDAKHSESWQDVVFLRVDTEIREMVECIKNANDIDDKATLHIVCRYWTEEVINYLRQWEE